MGEDNFHFVHGRLGGKRDGCRQTRFSRKKKTALKRKHMGGRRGRKNTDPKQKTECDHDWVSAKIPTS